MSCLIKFVRLNDFAADIDELDLTANGYGLAQDGYFPTAAPDDVASVREVITLKLQGASKDDLAAMTQEIDEKIKQVGWWLKDPGVERYQVWLRVQLENESLPRQAQIISIMPPDKVRVFTPEEKLDNYIGEYQIGIERTPFWEDPYPYPNAGTISGINCLGGTATLGGAINGDVPARLASVIITPTTNAMVFGNYWLGWKTSRFGTLANFVPTWALYLGNYITSGDMSLVGDATAYANNRLACDFSASTTMTLRVFIKISDVTANHADQRGTYVVLLRAKMSDGSIARVRMIYGFGGASGLFNPVYRSRQVISGTGWKLYEMGAASIPPVSSLPSFDLGNCSIGIEAERLSGTGELHLDCVILIPKDDGQISLTHQDTTNDVNIDLYHKANDSVNAYSDINGLLAYPVLPKPIEWGLPANSEAPRLVFAASGATSTYPSVKTDTAGIVYTYIPRFRTLRGNVT